MPLINEEDCCTFLEGKITEDDLQQLTRDELPVLAAYLGMYSVGTANRGLLLQYVQKKILGTSGMQEEHVEEIAGAGVDTHMNHNPKVNVQCSPVFSSHFGPHPLSDTVSDSVQQPLQVGRYTLPPPVIDHTDSDFQPIWTELERLKLES